MQGKRARFTDRLDDQEESLKTAFTAWERAYDDQLTMLALALKLHILGTEKMIRDLERERDGLEGSTLSELTEKMEQLRWRSMLQAMRYDYWAAPWWKRLFRREP